MSYVNYRHNVFADREINFWSLEIKGCLFDKKNRNNEGRKERPVDVGQMPGGKKGESESDKRS